METMEQTDARELVFIRVRDAQMLSNLTIGQLKFFPLSCRMCKRNSNPLAVRPGEE